MMRNLFMATMALAVSANAEAADATFLPGLYEIKVMYPDEGADVETSRECLTAAEAREESLERQLAAALRDSNCRFTQRTVAGGRFAIAGTCDDDGMRSSVKQSGTYSPTAMTMNLAMRTVPAAGAPPVTMRMVMSTRRVATVCPAGSDKD